MTQDEIDARPAAIGGGASTPSPGPTIDFEPLGSALRDGGPPYRGEDWIAWVRARRLQTRLMSPASPALGQLLGVPSDTVDDLLAGWHVEHAVQEFADPVGMWAALLRATRQYTAAWLADHGVTSAWVWRGEAVPGPRRLRRQPVTLPVRAHATPLLAYAAFMAVRRMARQGMPSGRLLLFRVPADRIVSTSMTGLGQPGIDEVIVDGGAVDAFVWPVAPRDDRRARDPSFGRRLLSEARWACERATTA
jgi:hypothetical protein